VNRAPSPPPFTTAAHPHRASATALSSYDNASNASIAVVLAERVQREAAARQDKLSVEFSTSLARAERERCVARVEPEGTLAATLCAHAPLCATRGRCRLSAQKQCVAALLETRKESAAALERARSDKQGLEARVMAAEDRAARHGADLNSMTTELAALRATNEEQSRLLAACDAEKLGQANGTVAAWTAEIAAAESESTRLTALLEQRDRTIAALQRQAEAHARSVAASAALGERTSMALARCAPSTRTPDP
jgi:chromosome segregation ATPase